MYLHTMYISVIQIDPWGVPWLFTDMPRDVKILSQPVHTLPTKVKPVTSCLLISALTL